MIEKPRRSLRRKIALAALGLGAVFVVVTIAGLFWDPVSAVRLSWRVKALRQAGEPVTPDEVDALLADPTPSENAATLYDKAVIEEQAHCSDSAITSRLPIQGPNATPAVGQPFPADMRKAMGEYLAVQKETLRLLHQAADLPACRFAAPSAGSGPLLARLASMRGCARLLAIEALERQESGKDDEAAESIRVALRAAQALRGDPELVSQLVGIACHAIALGQVERLAARAAASPAALQRLEAALRRGMDPRAVEVALVSFRARVPQWPPLSRSSPPGAPRCSLADHLGVTSQPMKGVLSGIPYPIAPIEAERFWALQALDAVIAAVRKPYPEALIEGACVAGEYVRKTPPRYVKCRQVLPSLTAFFREERRMAARLDSARSALAALRFRAAQGKLPDRLENLVPDFLDAVPPDPFCGQALLYRKEPAGFVIYSPGSNGVDDGGRIKLDQQMGDFPDVGFRVRWPKESR